MQIEGKVQKGPVLIHFVTVVEDSFQKPYSKYACTFDITCNSCSFPSAETNFSVKGRRGKEDTFCFRKFYFSLMPNPSEKPIIFSDRPTWDSGDEVDEDNDDDNRFAL